MAKRSYRKKSGRKSGKKALVRVQRNLIVRRVLVRVLRNLIVRRVQRNLIEEEPSERFVKLHLVLV